LERAEPGETLLQDYRILDLSDEKGFLCGKILGDMGADVILVERPGGSSARNIGPFYKGKPHNERSLHWFSYNANKRGITLNLETEEGKTLLKELVKKSDAVIESAKPGYMDSLHLGYQDLAKINPRIVLTSISHFGQKGPYSSFEGSDMVAWGMGGIMYLCGDPDRPPVQCSLPQAYLHAGSEAAAATMMALYHAYQAGQGQHVDVSAQACVCWVTLWAQETYYMTGFMHKRGAARKYRPASGAWELQIWPCKDGYVHFIPRAGQVGITYMPHLIKWLEEEGLLTDELRAIDWFAFDLTKLSGELSHPGPDILDRFEGPVGTLFLRYTKKEILENALKRDIILYPLATMKEVREYEQLTFRDFWQEVEHPELAETLTYPGAFAVVSEAPLKIKRRAPLIGEHNTDVYGELLGISKEELAHLKKAGAI